MSLKMVTMVSSIMREDKMNIYEMYIANGNKAGFWIQRDSWSNYKAQVITVQGRSEGELKGTPPYYNNSSVCAAVYEISTGEVAATFGDHEKDFEISCAGTNSYRLVDGLEVHNCIKTI